MFPEGKTVGTVKQQIGRIYLFGDVMEKINLASSNDSVLEKSIAEIREGFPQSYSISNKKLNSLFDQYLADYEVYLFYYLDDIWNSLYEGNKLSENNKIEFYSLNYQNHKIIIDAQITAMLSIYHILKNQKIKYDVWMEIFDEMAHYSFMAVRSSGEVYFDQVLSRFTIGKSLATVEEYKNKANRTDVKKTDPKKYKKYIFASKLLNYLRDYQSDNFKERKNWFDPACQIALITGDSRTFRNWYDGKVKEKNKVFLIDVKINDDDLSMLHNHWKAYFDKYLKNRVLKPLKTIK